MFPSAVNSCGAGVPKINVFFTTNHLAAVIIESHAKKSHVSRVTSVDYWVIRDPHQERMFLD